MHWLRRIVLSWLIGLVTGGAVVGVVSAIGTGEPGALAFCILVPVVGALTTWPVVLLLAAIHHLFGTIFGTRPVAFAALAFILPLLFASSNLILFDSLREGVTFRANIFTIIAVPCAMAASIAFCWLSWRKPMAGRRGDEPLVDA